MRPKIYFDGSCYVCSGKMAHYQKIALDLFEWVDFTVPGFDAQKEGLDPIRIHHEMHLRRLDGTLVTGVDAFIEIWKQVPSYRFLVPIFSFGPFKAVAKLGYILFARAIRPWLPKKRICLYGTGRNRPNII